MVAVVALVVVLVVLVVLLVVLVVAMIVVVVVVIEVAVVSVVVVVILMVVMAAAVIEKEQLFFRYDFQTLFFFVFLSPPSSVLSFRVAITDSSLYIFVVVLISPISTSNDKSDLRYWTALVTSE